jgi:putative tryptophan/tyrosine transport system substrate-binding protein
MRRRNFITLVTGAAALHPIASHAQQTQRNVPLVGVIWIGTASDQNITVEHRYFGDGPGPLGNAAEELVRLGVDVIVAMGTPAALAARRATSSIPIVAVSMADPVADGLIGSLAKPAGNVTGNTFIGPELGPKRLQLLKETFPAATRFAALRHPHVYGERTMEEMLSELEEKAHQIAVDFRVFDASRPEDFEGAFAGMIQWRADVLLLFTSPMFYVNYGLIVDLAARQRLPTMYYFREAVEGGGLIGYGADITDLFRLAAKHVAKILKVQNRVTCRSSSPRSSSSSST